MATFIYLFHFQPTPRYETKAAIALPHLSLIGDDEVFHQS